MKNFKRLAAAALAATMALALSVSAFAEAEVQNTVDASYADGKAVYERTITADNGTQMTVVIINKEKANTTLTGDDLLYINQDTASASLYANMGTKDDLLAVDEETGAALHAGDYLIRVGYYANNVWTVAEGEFTIGTKQTSTGTPYTVGDVDGNGEVAIGDVTSLIQKIIGKIDYFKKSTDSSIIPMPVGDVDNNNEIAIGDVTVAIQKIIGKIDDFTNKTYTLPSGTSPESTYTVSTN